MKYILWWLSNKNWLYRCFNDETRPFPDNLFVYLVLLFVYIYLEIWVSGSSYPPFGAPRAPYACPRTEIMDIPFFDNYIPNNPQLFFFLLLIPLGQVITMFTMWISLTHTRHLLKTFLIARLTSNPVLITNLYNYI